jgi:hypothetical protein
VRDAWAVTAHQVTYEGPPSLAVDVARLLADADGIQLTGAKEPAPRGDGVVLALTVEGTTEAVAAAVGSLQGQLPEGATITAESLSP